MSSTSAGNWLPPQQQRLDEFGVARAVDIHCHCLPGLDDGPATLDEAIELARALAADGVTTIVATPHQLGRYEQLNSAATVRSAVNELAAALGRQGVPLEILCGGDVRVDERLPELLDAQEVATVADAGRHLLLELPHEIFIDPVPLLERLVARGLEPVMTHPERHAYLQGSNARPREWIAAGAVLQVTAGSLLGDFGDRAYRHAWHLVEEGLVHLVASDAHDAIRRPPRLTAALRELTAALGAEAARQIALDNPLCVAQGERIDASANS